MITRRAVYPNISFRSPVSVVSVRTCTVRPEGSCDSTFGVKLGHAWTTVFVQLEGRVDARLEINIEPITEIAIVDQRPLRPKVKLHLLPTLRVATNKERPIPVLRTRVLTTNTFSAAEPRLPVYDNVSKTRLGH